MHHLSAVKYGMQSFLPAVAKGQLILKCPFGVFKSSKKLTKFFSRISGLASKEGSSQKNKGTLYH